MINLSDKIAKFLTKILFYPIIFFILYFCMIILGLNLVNKFYNGNDIKVLLVALVISSIISFVVTGFINIIVAKLNPKTSFKNWFEWSHLVLIYISGMVALLYSLQPIFQKEKVCLYEMDDTKYLACVIGFFIATSNYYFYKGIVITKDINLVPYIKDIKSKIKSLFGY